MSFLRGKDLRILAFLDDWLLVALSEVLLSHHFSMLVKTTEILGFMINWSKSELVPSRTPIYLEAQLDIKNQLARPSLERIEALVSLIRSLLSMRRVRAEVCLRWLVFLASLVDFLPNCRLFMRPFRLHLLKFFRPNLSSPLFWFFFDGRDQEASLSVDEPYLLQEKRFKDPLHSITVTTNESLRGWGGGHCQGRMVSGSWVLPRPLPHFNFLELCRFCLSFNVFAAFLWAVGVDSHGQHLSEGLHQQTRRDTLFEVERGSVPPLGMVQSGEDRPGCLPLSRGGLSVSRLSIPGQQTSSALLPSQGDFCFLFGHVSLFSGRVGRLSLFHHSS